MKPRYKSPMHMVPTLVVVVAACAIAGAVWVSADILDPDGNPDPSYPNFYAWYDADRVDPWDPNTANDGCPIWFWWDATDKGHDLPRGSADPNEWPTIWHDVVNGQTVVRFDGNDFIWGSWDPNQYEFGTIDTMGRTYFTVINLSEVYSGGSYIFDSCSSRGRNALFAGQVADPNSWWVYPGYGAGVATAPWQPSINSWEVHTAYFEITSGTPDDPNHVATVEHFINGTSVGSDPDQQLADMAGLILGSRYTAGWPLKMYGDMGEFLVYDAALSEADRQAVEGYLMARYGIVGEECQGDVDGDDDTDLADLAELLAAYGSVPGDGNWNPDADFDTDEDVDLGDLAYLLGDYGCGR